MKKIVMGGVVLAACTAMFVGASNVYAFVPGEDGEQVDQPVVGSNGITAEESTIEAKGTFYEFDPTKPDPGAPEPPEGADAWVNVNLPKTVIFGSAYLEGDESSKNIYSPRYYIQNMSTKDVDVKVDSIMHQSSRINDFENGKEIEAPKLNLDMVLMDRSGISQGPKIPMLTEMDSNESVDGVIPTIAGSLKEANPEGRKQHFELQGTVGKEFNFLENHDRIKSIWHIVFSFSTPKDTTPEQPEQPKP